jgi:O-antigen/teichoic acid export membrane protein
MRFIAQSYDAIVVFERRYTPSMLGEVVNFLITVGSVVILKDSLSYEKLLLILSAGYFLKSLILVVAFREYSKALLYQDAKFELLKGPFFFMLLTVTGMLASKIDIIMMTLAVDKSTLAEYQIILSFLALIQSGAALIFQPYVKVFYRINQKGKAKMAKSLSLWGLSLCALGLIVTYFILLYAYHIRLSEPMIITSFFYALMPFLSVPLAYRIYKVNRPELVLRTSILAIIIFVLMFSVINYFNIGDLSTILAIAALHQIGTVVLFLYFNRRKFLNS